jgi:hypothetical protein
MPQRDEVQITAAIRHRLKAEIRRTGITAFKLFKDNADLPEGLMPRMVNRWAAGLSKRARKDHLDYALSRYAALPDKASGRSAQWMKFTPAMADRFSAELDRTGKHQKACCTACAMFQPD